MKLLAETKQRDITRAKAIAEILRQNNDEFNAKIIEDAIESYTNRLISVAVVGLNKRGKSTFCNAWLGRHDDLLAPVDWLPATGVVTKFQNSQSLSHARITFLDGSTQTIPYEMIRDFVTEKSNPQNRKKVDFITVYGKFELDDDIELLDLPGDDSIHAYHTQIVYNYLPRADVIVFLSSADDPIRQAELKLLKKVDPSDGKKIFFVVNKADNCDEDELTDAQTHDLETLENAGIKYENHLYSISAKQAMEGKTDQFDFDRLSADIGNFILNNKLEIQRNGFLNTVRNATSAVTSALQLMITNEKLSDEELEKQLAALKTDVAETERHLAHDIGEFAEKWKSQLNAFERKLPQLEDKVQQRVEAYIKEIPMMSLDQKTLNSLPEKITEIVESEMRKPCEAIELELRDDLEKMNRNMPVLSTFLSESNYRVKVVSAVNSHAGSAIAGGTMITAGSVLGWIGSGITAGFSSVPWVGAILGGVAGVATSPLLLLGAPLMFGGSVLLALPFFGWVRGKKRRKQEALEEAQNSIHTAFQDIRLHRLPLLLEQGNSLAQKLTEEFQNKKKLLLDQLEEILRKRRNNENSGQSRCSEAVYRQLQDLLTENLKQESTDVSTGE